MCRVLDNQMQRSAVLIPSNIAEGDGGINKDYLCFLYIARGSLRELKPSLLSEVSWFFIHLDHISESLYAIQNAVRLNQRHQKKQDNHSRET
ncbi:four helix bundle protein [Endozoicomonas acroporae]|uniref:four helix bundle protein n=1 Tax=Endozoicomonas acroporae TaxID=1701104 RepID=UPI003D79A7D6